MSELKIPDLKITVETGSRLHFGLLSFGNTDGRQFGGVGVMVDGGGVTLSIRSAAESVITGPLQDRVAELVARYVAAESLTETPRCRVEVVGEPRHHVGLGTGTQLGLAVAAGLDAFRGQTPRDIEGLSEIVGRGLRSAVGAYGFSQGGFIYEEGKLADEVLSPLVARVALPEAWRFVLFGDSRREGLSGKNERESFAQLPPVSPDMTSRLREEIVAKMLPAAEANDFNAFGESIYRYGCLAGECFAAGQGGIYASDDAQQLVHAIRDLGVHGVGQSSWGPTIFALAENDVQAQQLVERLASSGSHDAWNANVVAARNVGATIQVEDVSAASLN